MRYIPGLIQNLRRQGIKVRVLHSRFARLKIEPNSIPYLTPITKENKKNYLIETKGGNTRIEITFINHD